MIDRATAEGVRVSTHPAESVASPFTGVVAVDGPSGSGKSTVSRRLAAALGARYLDTGAMYRSLTWAALTSGVDPSDANGVVKVLRSARMEVTTDPAGVTVTVDGQRVDAEIRGPEVTAAVSAVSAVPEVRAELVARQRAIIGSGGIVVEGRDIGTVVAPDAELKVFLTASAEARAQRRSLERASADVAATQADVAATQADLARRDRLDSSRVASPLVQADDAVVLDTTELGIDEVVARLLNLLHATAGSRR
jgi:cytidylate kinase